MIFALVASLLLFSSLLTAGLADGGANHRVRNLNFGVSGGNVLDRSSSFCCSGTLGALITDGSNQYILSNNHVLGRSGAAVAGEDVSQQTTLGQRRSGHQMSMLLSHSCGLVK
jgi:hypothetical protein